MAASGDLTDFTKTLHKAGESSNLIDVLSGGFATKERNISESTASH